MDAERLGIELGDLICETWAESIDDITTTLGRRIEDVFLEYVALLLWIVTKEASIVLPEKSFQHASNVTFSVTFDLLEDVGGIKKIKLCEGNFNVKTFESFIHNRFETYYGAWRAFPTLGDPLDDVQLSEYTVTHNFIVMCLTETEDLAKAGAEYCELFPDPDDRAGKTIRIMDHYHRFSERVRSVLSRY